MLMKDLEPEFVVVLDVETTGLSPAYGDRVCEVGLVTAQGDTVIDTFQSLVNPQREVSPAAAQVNGLSEALLRDAPLFAGISSQVRQRLEGQVVICHNAPFDMNFMGSEFSRLGLAWQPAGVIDTLAIARQSFHFRSNSLSAIASVLGLDAGNSHRALDDALTTFQVYRYFVHQLRNLPERGPIRVGKYQTLPVHDNLPLSIQEALSSQKDLEIGYVDKGGRQTRRQVTPLNVMAARDTIYLVAYCHLRQQERQFRLDRIVDIQLLE